MKSGNNRFADTHLIDNKMAETLEKLSSLAGPIGMGVSIASQIFGAVKGAQQNNREQDLLDKQVEENEADYNNTAHKSFLDTNQAKDQVKQMDESLRDQTKATAGRAVITGASDEAVVAANTGAQKNYNDASSNLAAQATNFQENQKRMYLGRKDRLNSVQMGINQQRAENASNLVGNAGDLFGTVTYNSGMKDKNPVAGNFGRTDEQQSSLKQIAQSAFK